MRKSKTFLKIFIPSAALVATASIVIPMVCLTTKHVHITRKTDERTHFPTIDEINEIKFTYTLADEDIDITNLHCSWGYTISSMKNCAISNIRLESANQMTFYVYLSLIGVKEHQIKLGDSISFDFHFSYWANDKVLWKQDILNNYIRVSEEAYD